jgi:hypothetical protein
MAGRFCQPGSIQKRVGATSLASMTLGRAPLTVCNKFQLIPFMKYFFGSFSLVAPVSAELYQKQRRQTS